jgi:hypothetical protein
VSETSASLEHDLEMFDASLAEMGGESASDCECCDCGLFGHPFAECIWTRDRLLGNLFGAESRLAQHGIIADIELIQFYQGVTSGGNEQRDAYGGKADYMFTFLGEQMALWKGLSLQLGRLHHKLRHSPIHNNSRRSREAANDSGWGQAVSLSGTEV